MDGPVLSGPVVSRFIDGPMGRLDARIHGPEGGQPVLILHPHPLLGGTMGSRLVYDLAEGLAAEGMRAVRFDFRGVGRSAGEYSEGVGETNDAIAVWDHVSKEAGRAPILIGYSFGAAVACRAATNLRPPSLVLIACPATVPESPLDPFADAARVKSPAHLVVGGTDPFCSPEEAARLAATFTPPAPLTIIPRAGHFLEPSHNARAVAAVAAALRE